VLIALFSDIHANREALDACLADARRRGAEHFVFLGDLVGYGADPGYVVDAVAELRRDGAAAIKGNHDAAIARPRDTMTSNARYAIDWTRKQLDDAQKKFLAGLPLSISWGDMLFVHADASNPANWIYILKPSDAERSMRAARERITFSGHVHRPRLYQKSTGHHAIARVPASDESISLGEEHKWHAVIGSVGQPRDENPEAAYALYDEARGLLTFARAPYDIEAAARKIRAAGLPETLAARLFVGR
jgi:diadenosine tetraphosphatase ApaH/serine/threonine PP2A family protein phosphatase